MKFSAASAILLLVIQSAWGQPAEIILIRHGEKPDNPAAAHLSGRGEERAAALVGFFTNMARAGKPGLPTALFASKPTPKGSGQRPGETLRPLSKELHLPVEMPSESKDYAKLAQLILETHQYDGKRVVICWVREYMPQLAAALGITPEPPKWKEHVYDEAYVISYPAGKAHLEVIAEKISVDADPTQSGEPLKEGDSVEWNERTATLKRLDTLPQVKSEYTKRFKFDSYDNPKLKELREHYKLDEVTAPGRDEFDKQVLLVDWTHQQFKKFGKPSTNAKGALEILKAIDAGHTFFCAHYAQVFVSSAASLGWVDRELALRRHQGTAKGGSTEHSSTEIWSNQYRKWVMLDPTSNMFLEKDGVPLNAYEIRQEWFYHDGKDLVFVIGKEREKYKKSDLPIFLRRFAGFGDLTVSPDELDKYGFTAYIPNTDLMDAREDYAQMFIVKDKLCDGTKWHERTVPANPAVDPYFPIGQAALSLVVEGGKIHASLKTLTPNFKTYEVQFDGGEWNSSKDHFVWNTQPGVNRLAARTVNQFGVVGPVSAAELEISK